MLPSLSAFCNIIVRYGLVKLLFTMGLFGGVERFKICCSYNQERNVVLVVSQFFKITCLAFTLEHTAALDT